MRTFKSARTRSRGVVADGAGSGPGPQLGAPSPRPHRRSLRFRFRPTSTRRSPGRVAARGFTRVDRRPARSRPLGSRLSLGSVSGRPAGCHVPTPDRGNRRADQPNEQRDQEGGCEEREEDEQAHRCDQERSEQKQRGNHDARHRGPRRRPHVNKMMPAGPEGDPCACLECTCYTILRPLGGKRHQLIFAVLVSVATWVPESPASHNVSQPARSLSLRRRGSASRSATSVALGTTSPLGSAADQSTMACKSLLYFLAAEVCRHCLSGRYWGRTRGAIGSTAVAPP